MLVQLMTAALLTSSVSFASSEGLSQNDIDNYVIAGFTRPCCSFGLEPFGRYLGIAGVIGKEDLGQHYFSRLDKKKDNVGMIYTCSAGFVDVSHLRDNADWSGHIYMNLPKWIGSGKEIEGRNEGGFKKRTVFFPKLSKEVIDSLTENDLEEIAVAIGFDYALMHEIATSFKIAVSAPATLISYETSSAFSLEDAFSNLMGNKLGAKAARSSNPFNQEMTTLLDSVMDNIGAQSAQTTLDAYEMVRNEWWIKGFKSKFEHVLRRDFTYEGYVVPRRIANNPFCPTESVTKLSIPDKLSNGMSVDDIYEARGKMSKKLRRSIRKLGIVIEGDMTQKHYPEIIEAVKKDFTEKLGVVINKR